MEIKEKLINVANIYLGADKVINGINVVYGAIAAVCTAFLGEQWYLFAMFLFLEIIDYITGYVKSKFFEKNENSKIGAIGIVKKVGYWVVIVIAFLVAATFQKLGYIIGKDLSFLNMIGYFTLATYIVNEIRSILENLVVMNVKVPNLLVKGMKVVEKEIEEATELAKLEEKEK